MKLGERWEDLPNRELHRRRHGGLKGPGQCDQSLASRGVKIRLGLGLGRKAEFRL